MVSKEENLYKQTWQHPKSRKWHCIDCVCINDEGTLKVMPGCVCEAGANCNTDHSMVRANLVIRKSMRSFRRASGRAGMKRGIKGSFWRVWKRG